MNEVKTPKKPLIVYYAIAILVVLLYSMDDVVGQL